MSFLKRFFRSSPPAKPTAGIEDALAAYNRSDYATAFPIFLAAASRGDAVGQFYLGLMHGTGRGVPHNEAEAVVWYRQAADQGLAEAQFNLALMFANGWGVWQSDSEAAVWLRLAADRGFKKAHGLMTAISDWPVNCGEDSLNRELARARWNKYIIGQGL